MQKSLNLGKTWVAMTAPETSEAVSPPLPCAVL